MGRLALPVRKSKSNRIPIDLSAESVAEFTEKPLLSLSCSDIGVLPKEVESNLLLWMKRARRWGAILLIDEADIYLEERTAHDFERNSLVSDMFLPAIPNTCLTICSVFAGFGILSRDFIPHYKSSRSLR